MTTALDPAINAKAQALAAQAKADLKAAFAKLQEEFRCNAWQLQTDAVDKLKADVVALGVAENDIRIHRAPDADKGPWVAVNIYDPSEGPREYFDRDWI